MAEHKKELTFFEAAATVAGYGIGGGIMAVPYLASISGIVPLVLLLVIGYFLSLLLHLMIAEMMMRDNELTQLVEVLGKYLFRGTLGVFFTWLFFVLIVIAFFGTLTAYIVGGGEILLEFFPLPPWACELIVYAVAAGVVFFGLKAVGISEKYAVIVIALVVVILAIASMMRPMHFDVTDVGGLNEGLALYGMIMFSYMSFFSVPQAVEGLRSRPKRVPLAVACGMGINFIFILIVALMAIGASGEVTKLAIIGWGASLGEWARILGSVFILLAMLTSFWSISLALAVILQERLRWNYKLSWLVATLPCLVVALMGLTDFLGFMRLAAGGIAVLVALLMVPGYLSTKKHGTVKKPAWELGVYGSWVFLALIIIGYVLIVVGSFVPIE
jgi:amino acid permease